MGLLWDPQVTHGKPKGYAFERQGNPKEGTPGQKSKVEEGAGFWQAFFHDFSPRITRINTNYGASGASAARQVAGACPKRRNQAQLDVKVAKPPPVRALAWSAEFVAGIRLYTEGTGVSRLLYGRSPGAPLYSRLSVSPHDV
jgi:hypothetical protein